ncbi:MAG: TonB-dependent receptor [Bacteroidales bacterium]|nr:TonB-dependent receptor [Bacteroidales bacterium]
MKFRASWGQLGNDGIRSGEMTSTFNRSEGSYYLFGESAPYLGDESNPAQQPVTIGRIPDKIGNPEIIWETQESTNFGIDVAFLENKISFTADYFIRRSKDLLLQYEIPSYFGYPNTPYQNFGEIKNTGLELSADYRNRIGEFYYSIGANITLPDNKVVKSNAVDSLPMYVPDGRIGTIGRIYKGRPMREYFGLETDGLFDSQEEIEAYVDKDGNMIQPKAIPGEIKFVDQNNDGLIDDGDRIVLGSPHPKFFGGFNIGLGWKMVSLDMDFQGMFGNKIVLKEKYYNWNSPVAYNSIAGLSDLAWHGPGTSDEVPILNSRSLNNNFRFSDYWLEDGSYLRMKSIQLSVAVPENLVKRVKISGLSVYLRGDNLLTFTKYRGFEPETYAAEGDVSQYGYILNKSVTGGVKVQF